MFQRKLQTNSSISKNVVCIRELKYRSTPTYGQIYGIGRFVHRFLYPENLIVLVECSHSGKEERFAKVAAVKKGGCGWVASGV